MSSDYECSLLYGGVTRDASCTTISRRASTSPSPAYRRKASTRAGSAGDGTSGSSEISSAFRRREAFIRAGRGASSRHSSSTRRRSSRRSTSCARRPIGGARRGCGASMRPGSCRNRDGRNSTTQAGSNRLEVSEQEVALLFVLDSRAHVPREGQMPSEISLPPRDRISACESLVGEGEREVFDAVLLARREGSDGVVRRRFGATEDRVDVGHLPLPDRAIHGGPNLAPMEAGRVRGVDHAVVFRRRAPLLEEPPDLVEQAPGPPPMRSPLCGRQFSCHGLPPLPPILPSTAWSGAGQI